MWKEIPGYEVRYSVNELEKLTKFVLENLGYDEMCNNQSEFQERINDQVRAFQDKCSVTFRNNDSTADNIKSEQSITDEELASKIKQELEDCGTWSYCRLGFDEEELDLAVSSIANLFKTYRTMPKVSPNNTNEVLVNKLELASEIAHAMLFETVAEQIGFDEEELFSKENYKPEFKDEFNHLYNNALKIIETYRTMHNSD